MNRRQLLKATLTGAVAGFVAPIAHALPKSERGVAPSVASHIAHGYRPTLLECFQEYPNGNYMLEDDVFTEHFYPKCHSLADWFETEHVIHPVAVGPDISTNATIFVRFKEGADKYLGIGQLLGITRQQAKVRYMLMSSGRERHWSNAGTVTGRISNCRVSKDIKVYDYQREAFAQMDFSKIEQRLLSLMRKGK